MALTSRYTLLSTICCAPEQPDRYLLNSKGWSPTQWRIGFGAREHSPLRKTLRRKRYVKRVIGWMSTSKMDDSETNCDDGSSSTENKKKTTLFCGQQVAVRALCTKCGLDTGFPLSGTKFFCENCRGADDPHQDGDSCSELNRF